MTDIEQTVRKLQQDINIRFLVAGVGCVLLLFFWFLGDVENLWPVIIVAAAITLLNLIIYLLIKHQKVNRVTEYIVSIVDFAAITYGASITGGIKSPFYLIYILVILIEGLYSNTLHVKYNLILSCISYSGLILFSTYGRLTQDMAVSLVAKLMFLLLTGGIALYYVRILLSQRHQIEQVYTEKTRLYDKVRNFNEELESRIKAVTEELNEKLDDIQHLFVSTVKALSSAIEAKDTYTSGHNERMLDYTLAILDELKESPEFDFDYEEARGTLQLAVLVHDIGKIGIPDDILQKPGSLTNQEWDEIKKHPDKGVSILEPIKELKEVTDVIKHHHERYDGTGYPEGIKAEEIPLISRIIAVADTFDAMTSDRPYRKRASDEKAVEEIKNCAGTQFDPVIVEAFLKANEKGKINSQ